MSGPNRGARRRRPTIADVAALAGVSTTTVSFIMNDRPDSKISTETRERVLRAVRDLGYVPSRQARNLGRQRTGVLGYHLRNEELEEAQLYSLSLFQPLVRAADARDYQIVAFTGASDDDVVERMRRMVAAHAVDGFILHDTTERDPRVAFLAETGFPFALWGRTAPDQPQSWVEIDQRSAFHDVVDHLVDRGHRHIGWVAPLSPDRWWAEREAAFRERMAEHGLIVADADVVRADASTAETSLTAILARADRPTALVTAGDLLAVRVYRAASKVGLNVGRDVAVTGFDPLVSMIDPPLTTLTISFAELAELLVARCLREIEGPTDEPGRYLAARLVVRESG